MNVIADLDGTIALVEHRRPLLTDTSKNSDERWRAFFAACVDDEPNVPVIQTLRALQNAGHIIIILSARSDEVKEQTIAWLAEHDVPWDLLRMRPAGDYTADRELKKQWLKDFVKSNILCVFDDRDVVVEMWREHGLVCFQVAEGNF